ncbi:LysR substrate-binding domain-containing protein [Micromonospora sp. NPDC007230]|uniref:LysR family transcriptional regulator n=1 Tax=Micromonospora sp. NPDC007230 TaxID=3364237 RepID=UPI0036AC6998
MDVKRMFLLADVARHGSITAAAHALSYTPSAISQQVKLFEGEVKLPLLERHPRGVRLTDAGRVVADTADKIQRLLQAAENELAEIAGLRRGSLRLGAFPTAGASLVPHAITEFQLRHPEVELSVRSARLAQMLRLLEGREIDVGLLWDYPWCRIEKTADLPDITIRHILDDPMEVVVARSHRYARRRRVRLGELAEDRWIIRADAHPGAEVLVRACRSAGFEPSVSFEAHDYQEAQAMVAVGLGVALIPRLALSSTRDDVTAIPLGDSAPVRRVLLARLADRWHTPASDAMIATFATVAARIARDGRPPRHR